MMVHGIVFLMCFLIVHLCWLLGPSVLENRYIRRKQLSILETNWSILSACHAGCLVNHPTPVGSVSLPSASFPAGFVSRSRIRTFGSACEPNTESSQPGCVSLPPVLITWDI